MDTPRWYWRDLAGQWQRAVAGSEDIDQGSVSASAELYELTTDAWSTTGRMITGRWLHTATLLDNGKVLIAGGDPGPLASAELYDPGD
jgi:hypothetical protein